MTADGHQIANGESVTSRVAYTEAGLADVRKDIAALADRFDVFTESLKDLGRQLAQVQRPNYTLMLGAGSIGITIIIAFTTMVFTFYGRDISRVELESQETTRSLVANRIAAAELKGRTEVGHDWLRKDTERLMDRFGVASEKTDRLLKELDDRLQVEMRTVNAVTDQKTESVDGKLQKEIQDAREERTQQIAELRSLLRDMGDLQRKTAETHADHSARIGALEKP